MCTLSWKPQDNGYMLLFNRDESRLRPAALPPMMHTKNGVKFLTPTDSRHGGTWLLVNEHAISVALLNNYAAISSSTRPAEPTLLSRGMLPLACADLTTVRSVIDFIKTNPLDSYPPFHLVAMGADEAMVLSWDGDSYGIKNLAPFGEMLTTSALNTVSINAIRSRIFSEMVGEMATAQREQLEGFHWYRSADAASGIRMQREDACTHSISQISVSFTDSLVQFKYSPQKEVQPDGVTQAYRLDITTAG